MASVLTAPPSTTCKIHGGNYHRNDINLTFAERLRYNYGMNADGKLLAAIADELKKYDAAEKAVLFGSRARGDNGARSDYDVAVYGALSHADKIKISYAFAEELPTLHKIDLIFMCDLTDKAIIRNIEKEGKQIYGKNA